MKPFIKQNNVLKSGDATVYVTGAKEERETILQLMLMALNAYYDPMQALSIAIDALEALPKDDPRRSQLEALKAQAEAQS